MTPIYFEVTRSNVKVTVAFHAKTMSAQYLEKFLSDSHAGFSFGKNLNRYVYSSIVLCKFQTYYPVL